MCVPSFQQESYLFLNWIENKIKIQVVNNFFFQNGHFAFLLSQIDIYVVIYFLSTFFFTTHSPYLVV